MKVGGFRMAFFVVAGEGEVGGAIVGHADRGGWNCWKYVLRGVNWLDGWRRVEGLLGWRGFCFWTRGAGRCLARDVGQMCNRLGGTVEAAGWQVRQH